MTDFMRAKVFAPCDLCGRRDHVRYFGPFERAYCTACVKAWAHVTPANPEPQIEEHW